MKRGFNYSVSPDEIAQFLREQGYQIEELYQSDGSGPFGFLVTGTTVQVDYDIVRDGRIVAYGGISLNNNPFRLGGDTEKADRSHKLYQSLYRRFRRSSRPVP